MVPGGCNFAEWHRRKAESFMLFGEWIRYSAFWVLDFLRGSKVRRHLLDIKHIMEFAGDPAVLTIRQKYLENILQYAAEIVPFYQKFQGYSSLKSFPVIDKSIIRENFDDFQSPEYRNAVVHNMHTSGSTGTPFLVRQDANKRNRVYAEMIYFWGKGGYKVGIRYLFLRIWTSINRKNRLSAWARNIVMWNILRLDDENMENISRLLKSDRRIKIILGYAGTLENLANYLLSCGETPENYHIKHVLSGAEVLTESARDKIQKVFGCPVISVYSNQENGLIAQECIEHLEFHLNNASYHVELLKFDCDEPVEDGEAGRIVLTDLFNHAMPLIRYDTGDIGIWKKTADCGWNTQALSSIEGGMVDYICDTSGKRISPHFISVVMWPYNRLKQFQFIQKGAQKYTLILNGSRGQYEDVMFVDIFTQVLGKNAEITVEHVDEIPVLNSGKRKIVVSKYKKCVPDQTGKEGSNGR